MAKPTLRCMVTCGPFPEPHGGAIAEKRGQPALPNLRVRPLTGRVFATGWQATRGGNQTDLSQVDCATRAKVPPGRSDTAPSASTGFGAAHSWSRTLACVRANTCRRTAAELRAVQTVPARTRTMLYETGGKRHCASVASKIAGRFIGLSPNAARPDPFAVHVLITCGAICADRGSNIRGGTSSKNRVLRP